MFSWKPVVLELLSTQLYLCSKPLDRLLPSVSSFSMLCVLCRDFFFFLFPFVVRWCFAATHFIFMANGTGDNLNNDNKKEY